MKFPAIAAQYCTVLFVLSKHGDFQGFTWFQVLCYRQNTRNQIKSWLFLKKFSYFHANPICTILDSLGCANFHHVHDCCRADSRLAPSQWETSLQNNAVSHWLGASLESTLCCMHAILISPDSINHLTVMTLWHSWSLYPCYVDTYAGISCIHY